MEDTPLPNARGFDVPFAETDAILTIDLGALMDNWRMLAAKVAPAECAAVVKADAYGIGIEYAGPALAKAGCKVFFVAHMSEGRRLRALLGDSADQTIYVLNGLHRSDPGAYARHGLRPVLCSREDLHAWLESDDRQVPVAVHVDTGMNRLGLEPGEMGEFKRRLIDRRDELAVELLISHFVSSEEPNNAVNAQQIAAFEIARRLFPGIPASLANSSGIFLAERPYYDLVRPGYALFGGNPSPGQANPMRPVVALRARLVQVRTVEAGAKVGYNGQWTAKRQSRLACLCIGYADGLPRAAGATDERPQAARAMVAGVLCPIVGRVSMDLAVLDATDVPPSALLAPGQFAELLGSNIGVDDLGRRSGTIGYDVLTGLGRRYHRVYVGG